MNFEEYQNAKGLKKVILTIKLYWNYNKVRIENENLKEAMKTGLYKKFMEKLNEPVELARYKKENKELREKLKELRKENRELKGE